MRQGCYRVIGTISQPTGGSQPQDDLRPGVGPGCGASRCGATRCGGARRPPPGRTTTSRARPAATAACLNGQRPAVPALAEALAAGCAAIRRVGGAGSGDRTLVDALLPAAQSLRDADKRERAVTDAALAAVEGPRGSAGMLGARGRSSGGVGDRVVAAHRQHRVRRAEGLPLLDGLGDQGQRRVNTTSRPSARRRRPLRHRSRQPRHGGKGLRRRHRLPPRCPHLLLPQPQQRHQNRRHPLAAPYRTR
ncbi:DAK2 domain-containing protein [Streptomyces olivaceus]|nr:DAK2 domain-containing protein [Streptomyces olivaceus]MBZ6288905.1 DAK2 domain-containing protein [Streptomyces olivaceus]